MQLHWRCIVEEMNHVIIYSSMNTLYMFDKHT